MRSTAQNITRCRRFDCCCLAQGRHKKSHKILRCRNKISYAFVHSISARLVLAGRGESAYLRVKTMDWSTACIEKDLLEIRHDQDLSSSFHRFCSRHRFQLLAGPGELTADDPRCLTDSAPRLSPSLPARASTPSLSSSPDALRPRQSPWWGRCFFGLAKLPERLCLAKSQYRLCPCNNYVICVTLDFGR